MKYLGLPTTIEDMTVSLGLTGVTILTKSRFKTRHSGAKELVQRPDIGIIHKSHEPSLAKRPLSRKRPTRKASRSTVPGSSTEPKKPKYRIDKKQVSHRIRGYLNQMKGEKMLYFWTVTFPQSTTDDASFILLNKWLTRLRQEKMLRDYLWITERQQNGTIHFHIVLNQKMNVQKANKYMRASIMHSINKGEVQYDRTAAMKYNGVDIAKDRKTRKVINFAKQKRQRSLTNYLTKYVTKNDGTFSHLAWHSSRGYSNLIIAVRFTGDEIARSNLMNCVNHDRKLTTQYFEFYQWKNNPPKDFRMYLALLNQHLQSKFN